MRCEPQLQLGPLESRLGDAVGGGSPRLLSPASVAARLRQVRLELRGVRLERERADGGARGERVIVVFVVDVAAAVNAAADALAEELVEERLVRHERGVVVFVRGMNLRAVDAVRIGGTRRRIVRSVGLRGFSPPRHMTEAAATYLEKSAGAVAKGSSPHAAAAYMAASI